MKLNMKVLSPVHIWSGNTLSPYTDYIYKNGKAYYIDNDKLIEKLSASDEMIDEYIEIIKNTGNNVKDKYKLSNLFQKYKLDVDEYTLFKTKAKGTPKNKEIHEIAKTTGYPYIPGSSIKGSIRTALMYDYMKKYGYVFRKIKTMSNLSENKRPYRKFYTGQDLFRKKPKLVQSDKLKFIQVTDTDKILLDNIIVYNESLIDYKEIKDNGKLKKKIPIFSEAISPGVILNFEIKNKGKKIDNIPNEFNYVLEGQETLIFKKINNFYEQNLKRYINNMKNVDLELFSQIISRYTEYINMIEEFKKNNDGFIMRLGSHKNLYDNTIDSLLKNYEMDEIKKAITGRNKNVPKYKPYPKTDWFIMDGNEVKESLGWVRVKLF